MVWFEISQKETVSILNPQLGFNTMVPICLVPRHRGKSREKKTGSVGLNGKGANHFSLPHSHNSMGTALNDPTTQWAPRSKRERHLGTRQDPHTS